MESADNVAYAEVFRKLKEEVPGFEPPCYMGDFDGAMRRAVHDEFPGTRILGCLFHYAQCIVKTASSADVGLHREIRQRGDILKRFLAFTALPLLPADLIVPVFEECATEALATTERVNSGSFFSAMSIH